jgi:enterochelin esterase family protein
MAELSIKRYFNYTGKAEVLGGEKVGRAASVTMMLRSIADWQGIHRHLSAVAGLARHLVGIKIALLFLICCVVPLHAASGFSCAELIALANSGKPGLNEAIVATFPEDSLAQGKAVAWRGGDFFFAIKSDAEPSLVIDDRAALPMNKIAETNIWYAVAHTDKVYFDHFYHYLVNGSPFGGANDLPALGPLSYPQPGVLKGTLTGKFTHVSKVYDGMVSEYQLYIPAEYDPNVPAPLMVFQDGGGYADPNGDHPVVSVLDNLIAQKKIPVMIALFINAGDISKSPGTPTYEFVQKYMKEWGKEMHDAMRSTEYDTVSDRYNKYLHEVLAEVSKRYNIRQDGYSRGTAGASSGGICAFNSAWWNPNDFSRVISWVGSFGAHQWKEQPDLPDGGQDYPEKVLREPHRNIRVWLADGSNDIEGTHGSWALDNIRMANALKMADYDFRFSFGTGAHSYAFGGTQLPEEMIWLWRDYDPSKTEQMYEMELSEKAKPVFRVSITNRDSR